MKTVEYLKSHARTWRLFTRWGQLALLTIALWGTAGCDNMCASMYCSGGLVVTLSGEVDSDTSWEAYTLEWREPGGEYALADRDDWGQVGWRIFEQDLSHNVKEVDLRVSLNGVVLVELEDEPLSWSSFECGGEGCGTQYSSSVEIVLE